MIYIIFQRGGAEHKTPFTLVFHYVTACKLLAALPSQHKVSTGLICGFYVSPSPFRPPSDRLIKEIKMQTKLPTECETVTWRLGDDSLKWTKFRNNGLLIYGPLRPLLQLPFQ